jgi:hypothetical protein
MLRRRPTVLHVLAVLAVARSAPAQDFTVDLGYEVRYGPLRVLSMELESAVAGDRYRATTAFKTEGLIDHFFSWRAESESHGRREGSVFQPEWHRASGTYRGERRTVEIDYRHDGAVDAHVTPPPEDDAREGVPEALQRETVDPLTASLLTVETKCRGRLPVFDGRRRYDLRLEELAPATVPASRGALYTGSARRCRATVEALAGLWRDDPRKTGKPTILDLWIASPGDRLPTVPVYIEVTGARGSLAVVLTKARSLDARQNEPVAPPAS